MFANLGAGNGAFSYFLGQGRAGQGRAEQSDDVGRARTLGHYSLYL